MSYFLLGLGSNILPDTNLPQAREHISACITIVETSDVLENPPCGETFSGTFHNQLMLVETPDAEEILKKKLEAIEQMLGREEKSEARKLRDRPIDIDILATGESPESCVPAMLEDSYNQAILQQWKPVTVHQTSVHND